MAMCSSICLPFLLLQKDRSVCSRWHTLTAVCLPMNLKAHLACNFNCIIETEGLLKAVTYCINVVMSQKLCKLDTLFATEQ